MRLSASAAPRYRFIYWYIGSAKRIPRSENTNTPISAHVATNFAWADTEFDPPRGRCVFARALAYAPNCADRYNGADFNLSIRDFATPFVRFSIFLRTSHFAGIRVPPIQHAALQR